MAIIREDRIGKTGGGVVRIMDDCCAGLTAEETARRHDAARREIMRVLRRIAAEDSQREDEG